MFIHEMTKAECLSTLAHTRLGRLACSHENQPYIVPIYFVYDEPYLYGFTTLGQKVEWMRSNPLVCVELDEIVNDNHWMSIVVFGKYEELPDSPEHEECSKRRHAFQLLQQHAGWWELGNASQTHRTPAQKCKTVYYHIRVERISGRRVTPSPVEPISARTPSLMGKVFHVLFQLFAGRRK